MKTLIIKSGVALTALTLLFLLGRCSTAWFDYVKDQEVAHDHEKATLWICPMHPQIRMPEFGTCPICSMDLVEMVPGGTKLVLTKQDKAIAKIQTVPVRRQLLTKEIRVVGKVDFDETRVKTISAWVPGRLDRLYVDYTGVPVKKGEHLVWLFSPDLQTAQQELIEARRRLDATKGEASAFLAKSNRDAYRTARDKLLLWGLTSQQVDEIEKRGTSEDHVLITSPTSGIVVHKAVDQGDYVKTGTKIYKIADLSHVWIRLYAYEQDLPWLRYGQEVTIQTQAQLGEVFHGWVSFIDPILDEKTRTVKLRVNVENPAFKLKPGMFVHAAIRSRVATGGRSIDLRLAGKWVSPMHPEVVKDGPGKCDICGMDLVPAEQLGYVTDPGEIEKPLVVPASAVLVTGTRAVLYVELPNTDEPTYEGRTIKLGPRAGDHYIVVSGVKEGERVVVHGAFRIDSAMQIQAKPSMMSQPGESRRFEGPEAALLRASLTTLYSSYFKLQKALAADQADASSQAFGAISAAMAQTDAGGLAGRAMMIWKEEVALIEKAILLADAAQKDMAKMRAAFEHLSIAMLGIEEAFGHEGTELHYQAFCSMAFNDKGASWLQPEKKILNPYFGSKMLHCGEVKREYPGVRRPDRKGPDKTVVPKPTATQPTKKVVQASDLNGIYEAYFSVQRALADDDQKKATIDSKHLAKLLENEPEGMQGEVHARWHAAQSASKACSEAKTIQRSRDAFRALSNAVLSIHETLGHDGTSLYFRVHCPMAFGDGADWMQDHDTVDNPYYGSTMPRCGSVKEKLPGRGKRKER